MRKSDYTMPTACFFTGVAVGVTSALLAAPRSGRRMRRAIEYKVEDALDSAAEAGHELSERGRRAASTASALVDKASSVLSCSQPIGKGG